MYTLTLRFSIFFSPSVSSSYLLRSLPPPHAWYLARARVCVFAFVCLSVYVSVSTGDPVKLVRSLTGLVCLARSLTLTFSSRAKVKA